jgi:tRNA-splicing ligase RtcB
MRSDPYQARARELCRSSGVDPDSCNEGRGRPAWTDYRSAARAEQIAVEQATLAAMPKQNHDAPSPTVLGQHDEGTIGQMKNCMSYGNVAAGVICADGHLGYAQPVGGVIAYRDQISVSGVGFDIACGNMAVKLDIRFDAIKDAVGTIITDIGKTISFGVGRVNEEKVDHELFESDPPPAIIDANSDLGRAYLAGMELSGWYAYAGREWVVERVRKIVGGAVLDSVHNHHNFA